MEQKVLFRNSKAQKIVGLLDIPDNIDRMQPCPAVLVLHGFKGLKEQPHIDVCAKELCKAGFVALRFDSSNGLGESDGDIFDCDLTGFVDDAKCALDFLQTLRYVDKQRIGMTGHSFGGQVTIIMAANDARVKTAVPQCAVFLPEFSHSLNEDSDGWKKKGYKIFQSKTTGKEFKLSYHFYEDRMNYPGKKMKRLAAAIKVPTMVIHSENDEAVPVETAHKLFETLRCEKELHIIKGAPHTFKEPEHLKEIASLTVNWFSKHLK